MTGKCENCVMWEIGSLDGKMDFEPPKHCPQDMSPKSGELRPMVMSYETLSKAAEVHTQTMLTVFGLQPMLMLVCKLMA